MDRLDVAQLEMDVWRLEKQVKMLKQKEAMYISVVSVLAFGMRDAAENPPPDLKLFLDQVYNEAIEVVNDFGDDTIARLWD